MSQLAPNSFRHGLPGVRPLIIGLFCAFILNKAGRKFAAHVIQGNIRKLLLLLPLRVRCRMVYNIFLLPTHRARRAMKGTTKPYGYQWDWIAKKGKLGHWIIPDVQEKGGLAWAEETANEADLVFFYIHGGGFSIGDSLMYTSSYQYFIEKIGSVHGIKARVFAVEYGLVPEVHWPQPRLDVEEAYSYLVRDLNISPAKIFFGGDSAGGNLTATTLVSIRNQLKEAGVMSLGSLSRLPLPMPRGAIMISPWTHLEASSPTYVSNHATDCLPIKPGRRSGAYIAGFDNMSVEEQVAHMRNPDISPLFANFEGVCPVLVTVGGLEIFQHEIEALVQKLQRDGVAVDVLSRPDAPHVWVIEPFLAPSRKVWAQGMNRMVDWCADRLRQ
ncbi:Alpha/Beta hydrolase protein [Fennellomyces sp. T-0311]|nr:Alpha/Beta hydrolase protein [Fennellomyces sp. T-0311]